MDKKINAYVNLVWVTLVVAIVLSNNIIEFLGNLGIANPTANLLVILLFVTLGVLRFEVAKKLAEWF